jgi:hypothetical protein
MSDTKRINGVLSATVGTDWIKLEFESHDITIEQLKVYNPFASQQTLINQQTEQIEKAIAELEELKEKEPVNESERWWNNGINTGQERLQEILKGLKV